MIPEWYRARSAGQVCTRFPDGLHPVSSPDTGRSSSSAGERNPLSTLMQENMLPIVREDAPRDRRGPA